MWLEDSCRLGSKLKGKLALLAITKLLRYGYPFTAHHFQYVAVKESVYMQQCKAKD